MKPTSLLIVFIFLCVSAPLREALSAPPEKPNILFIVIDDMNDWVGCLGGHPNAWTPNIDRLAKRGLLFTNGHTSAPVCNPSRAAFLSGIGPWRSGVYHNGDPWPQSEAIAAAKLLPHHFRESGYHTMMAGKIFHGKTGMEDEVADEQGGLMGGQSFDVIADDYPDPFTDLKGIHNFAVHWGGLEGEKAGALSDPKLAEWASERLRRDHERPFLLMVGFHRPHTPLTSPKEYWEMFDRETIQLPPLNPSDLVDMPWPGKQVAVAGYQEMEEGHYKMITERGHHRDVLRGYLAACTFVDAQVGKVLHALDRGPHRDNTIVVLFSDHGWGVGERYHFKKWGLWDDTTRVPYIVHVPGMTKPGTKTDAGVTLLDLYPTLVDLAGIAAPPQAFDGRSLRPLLENPEAKWDRPALTTFGQDNYALRTPEWRYIRWSNGEEELYDHGNDPHEWHNVAGDPENEAVKADLSRWFPEESVPSLASDHASPVTLTRKDRARQFRSVRPTFVDQPITVKATIGPKITDGVLLQHGGQFCGYSLYVKDGKLTLAIMDVPRPLYWNRLTPKRSIVTAESPLPEGKTLEVEGRLARDGTVTLWADGKEIGRGEAKTLSIHPAGIMQLGQAPPKYVPVGDYEAPFTFKGDLGKIEVTFGPSSIPPSDANNSKP